MILFIFILTPVQIHLDFQYLPFHLILLLLPYISNQISFSFDTLSTSLCIKSYKDLYFLINFSCSYYIFYSLFPNNSLPTCIAAAFFVSSNTCVYKSAVIVIELCPRICDAVFIATPEFNINDAQECLKS